MAAYPPNSALSLQWRALRHLPVSSALTALRIFMWFKHLKLYRLSPTWQCTAPLLEAALEKHPFHPGSRQELFSMGWVPPHDASGLVHAQDGQYLFCLRTEKKLLPATVINQVTQARLREIEAQQGYKPGRKQVRNLKEQVTDELLPKAFALFHDTRVWIDARHQWLGIDASAPAKCDEVVGMLAKVLEPFPVLPLHVTQSPASAMTDWLIGEAPPPGFSIDQETELRSVAEDRAAVRYVRQTLETAEMRHHVQAGKQCTRLALTWNDRVSFVLTENLDIKRITPLDILNENRAQAADAAEQFDADILLMTRELGQLRDALVRALGLPDTP